MPAIHLLMASPQLKLRFVPFLCDSPATGLLLLLLPRVCTSGCPTPHSRRAQCKSQRQRAAQRGPGLPLDLLMSVLCLVTQGWGLPFISLLGF